MGAPVPRPASSIGSKQGMSAEKMAKLARLRAAPQKPQIEVDKSELKKKLTPLQYRVTQEKFTERFDLIYFSVVNNAAVLVHQWRQ